jgi:tetratricopeptide (TPR) repeat protein
MSEEMASIAADPSVETTATAGEVDALRRRLDDHGAVLRKTQTQLGQLADSLATIVAGARRRERTLNLNSFVAYLLFTVLLGGGALLLYRTRVDELVAARDRAVAERTALGERARQLQEEMAGRDEAGQRAYAYWKLLHENKRNEAIAHYAEIQQDKLTPTERELFADGEKSARGAVVDAGYLSGLDAYRAGQLDKAIGDFKRALAYEEEGPRAAQMRYYLGVAQVKTGDAQGSVRELEKALAGRVEQGGIVDARFWLAIAYEKLGQFEQARTELDKFASAAPMSPMAVFARRKSAALAHRATPTN